MAFFYLFRDHRVNRKALTVTQICTGVAYETQAFQQQIMRVHTQAASAQQSENYRLSGEVQAMIQSVAANSPTKGSYRLIVQSTGTWVSQFSKTELGRLAASIAGKKARQATQLLLHTPGVQQVQLSNAEETLPTDPQNIHFLLVGQP